MKSKYLAFGAGILLFFSSGLWARAQSESVEDFIVNDPETRHGILANGVQYFVRANAKPPGMAELRLVLKVGSILEDDDQLGLAHFVEHMLFNGTERFPGNELVNVLESFGMEYGPEINAYTSFDETVYKLRVSTKDDEEFRLAFDILEEWAFNATLTEEEFEKERAVVLEEWRVGRNAEARMLDEIYPILFKGSRYASRRPIGSTEIIQNAPIEALRRFYRDWYRPDLMAVIAVGDFDAVETVRMIRERFAKQVEPEKPRPRLQYEIPGHDETLIKVVHDNEATRSSVQILIKHDYQKSRYKKDLRREIIELLFYSMFNQRLERIARGEDPPFLSAYGFNTSYTGQTSISNLIAATREDGILAGMEALLVEAERIRSFGFLNAELERARLDLLNRFEKLWKQRDDLESSTLIRPLMNAFLLGEAYPSMDWQWQTLNEILPTIDLEELTAYSKVPLSDKNRVVIVKGPSVPEITQLSDEVIFEVFDRARSVELVPWVDEMVPDVLVSTSPKPGRILSRSTIEEVGVHIWTLSNGARVILKPTSYKAQEILLRAYSEGGLSQVEDEDYISAQYAVDVVNEGGLGSFSALELAQALAGRNTSIEPYIHDNHEGFTGTATYDDFETLLELLYLHFTEPRRDENAWKAFKIRTAEKIKYREASPMVRYNDFLWETVFDGHPRSRPITMERFNEVDMDRALEIFAERFAGAADFVFIIVGDFDPLAIEEAVERWLGGLTAGYAGEGWVDRGMRNALGVRDVSLKAGSEALSMVTHVWSGQWNGDFAERYKIQSLAAALEMAFTRFIREDIGGTYSIGVYPRLNEAPVKDYQFVIQYSCAPDRVEELSERVRSVVSQWRNGDVEEKYAVDVSASQKRNFTGNLGRNDWWLDQIVFSVATGVDYRKLLNRQVLYELLSAEILSQTARNYLNDDNYIRAVLYPKSEDGS